MLRLVEDTKEKKLSQDRLERALSKALKNQGSRNIGFPGGNVDHTVYASGEGFLWVAFGGVSEDSAIPRFWNAFGVYHPDCPTQMITVEINIPTDTNSAQVAGFFARDSATGDVFLMHSGKVGGGRPGIGKSAFLVWSKAKLVEVSTSEGNVRNGIAVARLGDEDFVERVWAFVTTVHAFKERAATGGLDTPAFKQRIEEFERYNKEFSGRKSGTRNGDFEYVTYHGDIVHAIQVYRTAHAAPGGDVFNSPLIDLYVKKEGEVSEIYEVKTGVGRQVLYTAIGQLVTHAAAVGDNVAQYLVVPANEPIPEDLKRAMEKLRIEVRRFQLVGNGRRKTVKLI